MLPGFDSQIQIIRIVCGQIPQQSVITKQFIIGMPLAKLRAAKDNKVYADDFGALGVECKVTNAR